MEEPAAHEEKRVAAILKDYFVALENSDLELLASLFSEDADIHSYVCGNRTVTKKEHIQCMQSKIPNIKPVHFAETLIRIASDNRAIVSSMLLCRTGGKLFGPKKIYLELGKENSSWKIFKQSYIE